ncbi:hypothetical protein [Burkholderia gladioli]|uniref:hypothetical protein n=1 Tax=Burkholderia gladioli TaxID=28095 RepID=UPI000F5228A7|nr:hypothetical protein [Burkholderia gladioli]MBJ9709861.1 hypothetical protein [Burkholderia gladioli]MCH7275013.1 hypothetical protein [Burkholderia gladioli]
MKKYRVTPWGNIRAYEVVKETPASVTYVDGRRNRAERKIAQNHCWFDTWQECKDWLVLEAEKEVDSARVRLQRANDKLGNAKGLKEHKELA